MPRKSLRSEIKAKISNSQDFVFMPGDFFDLSDRDQVGRALRQLTKEQFLVKIGYGVYVKHAYHLILAKYYHLQI